MNRVRGSTAARRRTSACRGRMSLRISIRSRSGRLAMNILARMRGVVVTQDTCSRGGWARRRGRWSEGTGEWVHHDQVAARPRRAGTLHVTLEVPRGTRGHRASARAHLPCSRDDARPAFRSTIRAVARHDHRVVPRRTRVAVALGGGGARGYAHIGVLEVLEERGYDGRQHRRQLHGRRRRGRVRHRRPRSLLDMGARPDVPRRPPPVRPGPTRSGRHSGRQDLRRR